MELPLSYIDKMKELLGDESENYFLALDERHFQGLRVNEQKILAKQMLEKDIFSLEAVPWCREGFYYKEDERPAKHPYYHAGLYYLQEPSAMSPGAYLPIEENDRVLDICAAPGGKSTQIGAKLGKNGLLVANDISAGRAKILVKNIERFGIKNAMVLSETPERLKKHFGCFFDKILIDAPCSGEGMFRKEPDMVKGWNEEMLAFCEGEQETILDACAALLRAGGIMLYSTCTFSAEENEGSIGRFLERHDAFELVPVEKRYGFQDGIVPYTDCARLYPHKINGEGHFLACLRKKGADEKITLPEDAEATQKELTSFKAFTDDVLEQMPKGVLRVFGDMLYMLPKGMPSVKGLRALRTGWQLGSLKKGRFEPSQAFAMGLRPEQVKNTVMFDLEDERVIRYLKGESIEDQGRDGWTLVCVDGFPLGWAKRQKGRLKNKYAVSWKWE